MLEAADNSWNLAEAAHLMNRAGFGTSPDELQKVKNLGRKRAVKKLLNPIPIEKESIQPPVWTTPENLKKAITDYSKAIKKSREDMPDLSEEEAKKERLKFRRQALRERKQQQISLLGWWFEAMTKGSSPLREKMTFFWHDHFATSVKKVKQPGLMYRQNALLRKHALGNFRDLTAAIASDPAMMVYLDTSKSSKENPNENFARELLELFTLGEGNYTEQDIKEAARAFTGYRLNRITGKISQSRNDHDFGRKTFLGQSGNFDAPKIIEIIFSKRRPAEFLAEKLWLYFADDKPDQEAIAALSKVIFENNYQIKPALKHLFESKVFYAPNRRRNQIKSPVDFLAQMTNQLEVKPLPVPLLLQSLEKLGQVPFLPPNVAGWKEGRAFINTNTLLSRYNIAGMFTKGGSTRSKDMGKRKTPRDRLMHIADRRWKGPNYKKLVPEELRSSPAKLVTHLSARLFQDKVSKELKTQFLDYAESKSSKGKTLSDEDVAELVHLMMSTPQYQLC